MSHDLTYIANQTSLLRTQSTQALLSIQRTRNQSLRKNILTNVVQCTTNLNKQSKTKKRTTTTKYGNLGKKTFGQDPWTCLRPASPQMLTTTFAWTVLNLWWRGLKTNSYQLCTVRNAHSNIHWPDSKALSRQTFTSSLSSGPLQKITSAICIITV